MNETTTLDSLVSHLQSLVRTLPNVPSSVGALDQRSGTDLKPVRPLPSHAIPPLPADSFSLLAQGRSLQDLISYLSTHILPHLNAAALSPNYYGLVTGGTTPAALLADWLVSLYDQNVSIHVPSETICTNVEVATLNQLVDLFNLPPESWGIGSSSQGGGTFTTGATASNILGLATGREWVIANAASKRNLAPASVAEHGLLEAAARAGVTEVKLLSALPHSSVVKAAAVLGMGRSSFISVAPDTSSAASTTLDLSKLAREAAVPHRACILIVGAGEVNTGRFATTGLAQWQELRRLCDDLGVWIHVDGAFGLFARALPTADTQDGKPYAQLTAGVAGIELADSITGDAHKLLNVPYDCGFFFARHKGVCEAVFLNRAAYLSTTTTTSGSGTCTTGGGGPPAPAEEDPIQTPLNIGLENSRRFRALPVHATLTAYGRAGYVDMLRRQIALARRVVAWLCNSAHYEVLPTEHKDSCGDGIEEIEEIVAKTFVVVLFRAREEAVNETLVQRIKESGKVYVSGTVWEGRKATRLAVSNWQVDVERDGRLIEEVLGEVVKL